MADPLTVIGGISAVGQILGCITKTVHDLAELRAKFKSAAPTIGLLISELTAIKGALVQIGDWAKYNAQNSPLQEDLRYALEVSLDGCHTAMDALSIEVGDILGKDTGAAAMIRFQARFAWNEESMKEHQQRLHTQIGALQLLLQAVQIRTLPGQAALLREPKTKELMQKVKDDTSSIRASMSVRSGSVASASRPVSTIGSTVFDGIDEQLMMTGPYTNYGARVQARHAVRNESREDHQIPERSPSQSSSATGTSTSTSLTREPSVSTAPSSHTSQKSPPPVRRKAVPKHARVFSASDAQLPMIKTPPSQPPKRHPYEPSFASEPLPVRGRYASSDASSNSDTLSPSTTLSSFFRNKSDSKVNIFSALRSKKSRASFGGVPSQERLSPNSLSPTVRRRRSHEDEDPYTSVQFPSRESVQRCPLIQAAQSGSGIEVEDLLERRTNIEEIHPATKRTALAVAAHCGNDDIVAMLTRKGANLNARDYESKTPLHLASSRGHYRAVERLLKEGAGVDAKDGNGRCPLRLACESGHQEVVGLLLRYNARVNTRDSEQLTPLHASAKAGDDKVVQMLVNAGADPQARDSNLMSAMHYAAEKDHCAVVEALYSRKSVDLPGKANMTPLTCACAAGSTSTARLLLKKNASTKAKGDGDMTALHWASYEGHYDIVDMLLDNKATLTCKTQHGRTPLHLAAMSGSFSTAELLVRRKAPVDAPCSVMMRPLHYAIESGAIDIAKLLISSRANLEAESNPLKWRPLHIAVTVGHAELVSFLVSKGASIDPRDFGGDRPLCLASAAGHVEIVKVLLDAGAEIRQDFFADRHDSHKDSPLCLAAKHGHVDVAATLLDRGAHPLERDERNWQPLRYAAYFGHPGLVALLLDRGATIAALGASGGWGFEMTPARIGFSSDGDIDDVRRAQVTNLLMDAERREHVMQSYQTQLAVPAPPPPVTQTEVAEIDNRPNLSAEDDRRTGEAGYLNRPIAELRGHNEAFRVPVGGSTKAHRSEKPVQPPMTYPQEPSTTKASSILPTSWSPTLPVSYVSPPTSYVSPPTSTSFRDVSALSSNSTYTPPQQPYPTPPPMQYDPYSSSLAYTATPAISPPNSFYPLPTPQPSPYGMPSLQTPEMQAYTPPSAPPPPAGPIPDLEGMVCAKCRGDGLTAPDLARCEECRGNFYKGAGAWYPRQASASVVAGGVAQGTRSQELFELGS